MEGGKIKIIFNEYANSMTTRRCSKYKKQDNEPVSEKTILKMFGIACPHWNCGFEKVGKHFETLGKKIEDVTTTIQNLDTTLKTADGWVGELEDRCGTPERPLFHSRNQQYFCESWQMSTFRIERK